MVIWAPIGISYPVFFTGKMSNIVEEHRQRAVVILAIAIVAILGLVFQLIKNSVSKYFNRRTGDVRYKSVNMDYTAINSD